MRSPVVLDERYVYFFTAYYTLAAAWGLLATRNGLLSISEAGGAGAEALVSFAIAVLSGALAFLCTTDAQRLEKWLTALWITVVAAFPAATIYLWLAENDLNRAAPSASTLMYLVFPFARFVYLASKTRRPRGSDD